VIKSLIKVLLFVLIPCGLFAQVLPAPKDSTDRHVMGYEFGSPLVLLGVGWNYTLDCRDVSIDEIEPFFEGEEWYDSYRFKGKFWKYSGISMVTLELLSLITGSVSASQKGGKYVLVGSAAMVPLLWLSFFEYYEVQNMKVDSYNAGRDIQGALMEREKAKAQLQTSKKMYAAGVFMAIASAALIATGGVAMVNDKNYGHFLMMGGVVSIPFGAVMMLVSHASYSSAIIHYNRPEE